MAIVTLSAFGTRSANLAGTALDSLASDARSTVLVYNNTLNYPYGNVTVKLGSLFPSPNGALVLIKRGIDGTDTSTFSTNQYTQGLQSVNAAAVVVFEMVLLNRGNNNFVIWNLAEVALAATGNEFYVTPFTEEIT